MFIPFYKEVKEKNNPKNTASVKKKSELIITGNWTHT